ncbi:hypothetical protein [Streptomyces sp. NPDC058773]|uniref:hypothetical protein n=1 Tax=Streptomyces sp. NPDC058773 TaxID=3346632 RepID=UPI0036CBE4DF
MDQHAERPGARAARSHGTVEPEHGATTAARDRQHALEPAKGLGRRIPATVTLPVITALAFGCFIIFRTHTAGIKGGPAMLYGLAGAVVSGALGLLVAHFQSSMITETRAASYGTLFGCAMGWVYSLGGEAILKSCAFGLTMGAVMFVASLYLFRTHRTREPHDLHRPHKHHHRGARDHRLPVATH